VGHTSFLEDVTGARPWQLPDGAPEVFTPTLYYLGQGTAALEVVVVECGQRPSPPDVRTLWKRRQGNRPSPVFLVVLHTSGGRPVATICGPEGDDPVLLRDLDPAHVERIAKAALAEPSRLAAARFLVATMGELESELPGLRNEGLFAAHELRTGVIALPSWPAACEHGRTLLVHRGRGLVEALGFTVEAHSPATSVLRAGEGDTATAVAIFLDETETYEGAAQRFNGTSPVSFALAKADADRLPFVVITRGAQIRLYAADKHIVGVGRKGRTETFIEANLALLPEDKAGYLPLLFGAAALLPEGTFETMLERSKNFASELSKRLRQRVYEDVVPALATAAARRTADEKTLTEADLRFIYEESLFVLFRLVFIAYAEDKGLLPYATSSSYRDHALKTEAQRLADRWNESGALRFDENATDLWAGVKQLFRAVDQGNSEWEVPAYDGGLFSVKEEVSRVGAAIEALDLTNAEFGPPLASLLVDLNDEGVFGAIDFRSLSVREFGTIYEGLLESDLSFAQSDLALDKAGAYVPARESQTVVVRQGDVYLHNQSGARKASGSYFTKEFAVEHLLDHALEPALDDHVARLTELIDRGDEASAGEAFFDFRVADISMGSGHFLVNAVDHIEARLTSFLTEHPLPAVNIELDGLRKAALERLGDSAAGREGIEQAALVRRQVARRCIYGVDLNSISVELARLALWIHTFIPGLPLSFLDRTLVCGNSLTGIGSLDDAVYAVEGHSASQVDGVMSLAREQIEGYLEKARGPLARLGRLSDATLRDVQEARVMQADAVVATATAGLLFDLALAARRGEVDPLLEVGDGVIEHHDGAQHARELSAELGAVHFPIAFPEVFLRDDPGFDCILGNPPWDKVRFEAQQFWVTRFPGLKSLGASDQDAAIEAFRQSYPEEAEKEREEVQRRSRLQAVFGAAYRLQGRAGHHEYAKLFAERALALLRDGGALGYVLPRQSLVLGGWSAIRRELLSAARVSVIQARNKGGWLFEDVHQSYMVVLLARLGGSHAASAIQVMPAVTSQGAFDQLRASDGLAFSLGELESVSDTLVIPWFESPFDAAVFNHMRSRPRLGSGQGWVKARAEANRWDFSGSGRHKAFVSPKESDSCWRVLMAAHVQPLRIDQLPPFQRYIAKPAALTSLHNGVSLENGSPVLDESHPAIVYRYPTRNTDSRTLIAAMLPRRGFLPSKGYTHLLAHAQDTPQRDVLALLGFLTSYVCDWWIRRFVDRHLTKPVLEGVRLPAWDIETREVVAAAVTGLLARDLGEDADLAGEMTLASNAPLRSQLDDHELRSDVEVAVARGFGIDAGELRSVLDDFSDSDEACPRALRRRILEKLQ